MSGANEIRKSDLVEPREIAGAEVYELVRFLSQLEEGHTFTYEEIKKATGIDIQKKRSRWARAKKLLWERGVYLGAAPAVGIKRHVPGSAGALGECEGDINGIRKRAKRTLRKVRQINHEGLTGEELNRLTAAQAMAGIVEQSTSSLTREQLRIAAEKKGANALVPDTKEILSDYVRKMRGE